MKFLLIDTQNLFYRTIHSTKSYHSNARAEMALHVLLMLISQAHHKFSPDHVVFCFDNGSWRYDIYDKYKANRKNILPLTEKEIREKEAVRKIFDDFKTFVQEKTNASVLNANKIEADDFIARWTQTFPNDSHIIISSDKDFYQLLNDNTIQYDGMKNEIITHAGILDGKERPVIDKKTGKMKTIGGLPEYVLFEKCIRGDPNDNIFPAYPGARKKGTAKNIGIMQAFEDRVTKGFAWNNFMLHTWVDVNNKEHLVAEDYKRNQQLIDLKSQPPHIVEVMNKAIVAAQTQNLLQRLKIISNFGVFLKEHKLHELGYYPNNYGKFFELKLQKLSTLF